MDADTYGARAAVDNSASNLAASNMHDEGIREQNSIAKATAAEEVIEGPGKSSIVTGEKVAAEAAQNHNTDLGDLKTNQKDAAAAKEGEIKAQSNLSSDSAIESKANTLEERAKGKEGAAELGEEHLVKKEARNEHAADNEKIRVMIFMMMIIIVIIMKYGSWGRE
jgi:hypothetical protein